ncbi:hypothetical protein WFZ85_14390 [Flavobacterium sp. j3]|uniref:Uncharacterized protein n=1 Tax=Flavobacterium aureirubrum TaxID=3133147 RepID=A0ABU9N7Z2_9FLAO
MDNSLVIDEIEYWNGILAESDNPKLLEMAFFKIYIKFEKFTSDLFIYYCTGQNSSFDFCPERKLPFVDDNHLNGVIGTKNKAYINYYENIIELSEHIFVVNPFEIITRDVNYFNEFNNMKILRNYIAHESLSSRKKYVQSLLGNRDFIEPYEFLRKIRRNTGKSNLTTYNEIIINSTNYLIARPA